MAVYEKTSGNALWILDLEGLRELLTTILISAGAFIFGVICGWFARTLYDKSDAKESVKIAIAVVVTMVWAGSTVASIIVSDYETPFAVHALLGGIVGSFFGGDNVLSFFKK